MQIDAEPGSTPTASEPDAKSPRRQAGVHEQPGRTELDQRGVPRWNRCPGGSAARPSAAPGVAEPAGAPVAVREGLHLAQVDLRQPLDHQLGDPVPPPIATGSIPRLTRTTPISPR